MALSRISVSGTLNILTRVSRTASLEIQRTTPAALQQALHASCVRCYPDPPTLSLPTNVSDIFANETGRFTPERARDIALYTENGGIAASATRSSGFPKICDNGHVDSYDCFGAVSLNGTMQSNVPKPYSSDGKSTHLNMPGGQWSRDGTATNVFIMNPLLQPIYRPTYTIRMGYSTNASEAPKGAEKDQAAVMAFIAKTRKERFRLMMRDYGGTLIAFHVTISLISLGVCYVVVISGIDVMPYVHKLVGEREQLEHILKTSTDFLIAYTIHKLLAPFRISISLAVTPVLVRYLRKIGLLKMPKIKPPSPSSS